MYSHNLQCNLEPSWSPVQVFGQVYIPVVNHVLMGLTMIVVGTFQTSARLGEAYGMLSQGAILAVF